MSYKPPKRTAGQGSARIQRMFQILTILEEAASVDATDGWRTSGNIAKCMGLAVSPHFRGLLDELLRYGLVGVREKAWRKNMVAYEWCIQEKAYHHEMFARAWVAYHNPEEALA